MVALLNDVAVLHHQNHVRTLQHECQHCGRVVLSNSIPIHASQQSGYPGAKCPHCLGDLAGAVFVNWADVEAIYDNLIKVPVDILLFFVSYYIQRRWVFGGGAIREKALKEAGK